MELREVIDSLIDEKEIECRVKSDKETHNWYLLKMSGNELANFNNYEFRLKEEVKSTKSKEEDDTK